MLWILTSAGWLWSFWWVKILSLRAPLWGTLQRCAVLLWLGLTVLGAVNQSVIERVWGKRLDLFLPSLSSGYIMFVRIPRSIDVHTFARANAPRQSVAALPSTQGLLYARARMEANLTLFPALLEQICRRHVATNPNDPLTFFTDQYKLNLKQQTPYRSLAYRCEADGLRPVPMGRM